MKTGWGLDSNDLALACQEDTHIGFYNIILEKSNVLRQKNANIIFDKTPRYITRIKQILILTEFPIIAMIKDPRAIAASDFKRAKLAPGLIDTWYENWLPKKLKYMRRAYAGYIEAWGNNRCIVVRLEDLCLNTRSTLERMFLHAGIEPRLSYLDLKVKRYANTTGPTIDATSCISFIKTLPSKIEDRILADFYEFDRWFYDFGKLR